MKLTLLHVEGLNKAFGPHYALYEVGLDIVPGEVHALIGENGAGKSTFIKILTGVYTPDAGQIIWNGKEEHITSPGDARKLGINVVHQDRNLVPSFTGVENLYLGLPYPRNRYKLGIGWKQMQERAQELMTELGLQLDLNKPAARMSPPEKTLLEIMRAMMLECRLLILDEPTASLTDQETESLFTLIRKLAQRGTAILYVSHRMDEITRISDRVTVLRNGQFVATTATGQTNRELLIRQMSSAPSEGPGLGERQSSRALSSGKNLLEVESLASADGKVKEVSLKVREGEVVGIFGLAGAGRTELLETIYGLRKQSAGKISLHGQEIRTDSPRQSLDQGIVLIPEERKRDGLVMNLPIRENMTLSILDRLSSGWRMRAGAERQEVDGWMTAMKVKASGMEQPVRELSGGNQQKVVFAKALLTKPALFLCDEPTQAVDVMTREEIHRLLIEQAREGRGVLFVSSDLQEVLELSDRLYVLHEGRIAGELDNAGLTPEQILAICYNPYKGSEQHG
ncbi:sugar ABC transporter ATP-binding protein [Paenibacillus lutrae]|uniref:ATP-binding cassette domain-containing protein n=1 Tax=Paenibacillus lutrae TaxID=2078573 RepID=A0A7X3FKQ9_9BACL|nr:sugar ABC transporter ATP-binding protein [Paenibacillus lutrae]MVP01142.1 ATP-binding cassette domain-containing protein [Paenibacillus lutrae]